MLLEFLQDKATSFICLSVGVLFVVWFGVVGGGRGLVGGRGQEECRDWKVIFFSVCFVIVAFVASDLICLTVWSNVLFSFFIIYSGCEV